MIYEQDVTTSRVDSIKESMCMLNPFLVTVTTDSGFSTGMLNLVDFLKEWGFIFCLARSRRGAGGVFTNVQ
jgi:hypothetical protein